MRKQRFMLGLVLLAFFLLPTAGWASDVPEVTEEEYRFYLEMYGVYYLEEQDFSQYTNEQLQQKIIEAVHADGEDYVDFLEYNLWDDYHFPEESFGKYTVAELERFWVRALCDDVRAKIEDSLKENFQLEVNVTEKKPQEVLALYYRTKLEQEFQITDNLSNQSWYALELLYQRTVIIAYIKENYAVTDDLSAYSLEELNTLLSKYEAIRYLQSECGVTEDLSHYTQDELDQMRERLSVIKEIQENYGVTEVLSGYTQAELELLKERLSLEQSLRMEYGVTEDLSNYNLEQLRELQLELWTEANDNWWDTYAQNQRNKIEIQINGEDMHFTEDGYWRQKADGYSSDVRPIMKDDHVYIPFRAVFEALGADISYDTAHKTVTAQRETRTISFRPDAANYVMNGVSVATDQPAFVQNGRIYVPVRFASQALGVAVGWDGDNRTVIILDKEKLIQRYRGQFKILKQYLQHWDFLADNNFALQGTFTMQTQLDASDYEDEAPDLVPLKLNVEMNALTSYASVNLNTVIQLDLETLLKKVWGAGSIDQEMLRFISKLKQFQVQCILDLEKGKIYLKSDLLDLLEGERNAWYCITLQDYLDDEEYDELLQMLQESTQGQRQRLKVDLDDLIQEYISALPVDNIYTARKTLRLLQAAYRFVGDNSLGKTADGYVHSVGGTEEDYESNLKFLTDQNTVTGIQLSLDSVAEGNSDKEEVHILLAEQNHVITLEGQCHYTGRSFAAGRFFANDLEWTMGTYFGRGRTAC